MSDISSWSTTAGSNNSSPPNGWPEGMAPSGVNDCGREVMAAVRRWYEDAQWINFGHTPTRVDNDTFTVATDLTAIYETGRRLKVGGSATGYCTIASSSYSAPNTTINVTMDSGNLPGTLSTVSIGILSYTSSALPLIPDGRLSSNVPLKNAANTFSAVQRVSANNRGLELVGGGGTAAFAEFSGNAGTPGTNGLAVGQDLAGHGFLFLRDNQPIDISTDSVTRVVVGPGVQVGSPTGGDKGAGTLNSAGSIYVNNVAVITSVSPLTLGAGVQVGSPTGGDKGAGTLNAAGTIYQNNAAVALADGSNLTALPAISGASLTNLTAANIAAGTAGINISGNAATATNVTSSTYTPTGFAGANIANLVTRECQYMRVGSVVTVSGAVEFDFGGAGFATFSLSLPVASNFSQTYHAAGAGKADVSNADNFLIKADATNDRLNFNCVNASGASGNVLYFIATYQVI